MATENIPQLDKMIKDLGNKISKITGDKQRDVEEEILRLRKLFESEEKSMLHNVTVSEDKVLEEYWCIRAIKTNIHNEKVVVGEMKCTNKPTLNEIAAFLKNSGADFVSVVQNYRFESDLPF